MCDLPDFIPSEYKGEVIRRNVDPRSPVLVEWTKELKTRDFFYWDYNSVGYVVPSENVASFRKWARVEQISESLVEEFFSKVLCVFYAKYELEGIWVMSHVLDSKTICERIGVKEINEKIAQGIKAW